MGKNLKEALLENAAAAAELDRALRDCLAAIRERPDTVVEGRFRVVDGGRRQQQRGI